VWGPAFVKLYSNVPVGTPVGTLEAYSDAGIASVEFIPPVFTATAGGDVLLAKLLTVGANQKVTINVTSLNGKSTLDTIEISVMTGKTLPASDLRFTPLPLDNQVR
jgi:hypothetical protein